MLDKKALEEVWDGTYQLKPGERWYTAVCDWADGEACGEEIDVPAANTMVARNRVKQMIKWYYQPMIIRTIKRREDITGCQVFQL